MESNPEFLNEEEAAQLWQRAAQLQAEAARRAEKAESDRAETEASGETADVAPPEGYALTHVRSAALEVGIANEFVDAALADLRAGRALSQGKRGWRPGAVVPQRPARDPNRSTCHRSCGGGRALRD